MYSPKCHSHDANLSKKPKEVKKASVRPETITLFRSLKLLSFESDTVFRSAVLNGSPLISSCILKLSQPG